MKKKVRNRILELSNALEEKVAELSKHEDFELGPYTRIFIDNLRWDLDNTNTFLQLSSNDAALTEEIEQRFHTHLNELERRISNLRIIKA